QIGGETQHAFREREAFEIAETRRRLVEQEQPWVRREGPSDLEHAAGAGVHEPDGHALLGQTEECTQSRDPLAFPGARSAGGESEIVTNRDRLDRVLVLERAAQAAPGTGAGGEPVDREAVE